MNAGHPKTNYASQKNALQNLFLGVTDAYTRHWILMHSPSERVFLVHTNKINNPLLLMAHEKKGKWNRFKAIKPVPRKDQCQSYIMIGLSISTMNKPKNSERTDLALRISSEKSTVFVISSVISYHSSISLPKIISWTKAWSTWLQLSPYNSHPLLTTRSETSFKFYLSIMIIPVP